MLVQDKIFNFLTRDLDEFELSLLLKDIEANQGKKTSALIKKRLRQINRGRQKVCVTCGNILEPFDNKFTLLFGPDDFQKRACFCALDCMEFFLNELKHKHQKEEAAERPSGILHKRYK